MRKIVILVVLFCLVTMIASIANAGPAPNLTSVKIAGLGTDAAGNWITPVNHSIYPNKLSGDTLYLCVEFTGYPNWNLVFFYQNGSIISKSKLVNYKTTYMSNDGVIRGYIKYYSIPFAELPSNTSGYLGQFSVKANGIRSGICQDHVNNVGIVD